VELEPDVVVDVVLVELVLALDELSRIPSLEL